MFAKAMSSTNRSRKTNSLAFFNSCKRLTQADVRCHRPTRQQNKRQNSQGRKTRQPSMTAIAVLGFTFLPAMLIAVFPLPLLPSSPTNPFYSPCSACKFSTSHPPPQQSSRTTSGGTGPSQSR
jgi:hypothetical protein